MFPHSVKAPTIPIPFRKLLKVTSECWDDRAQPSLDYFHARQESHNRFPGFNCELHGVFQERVDGRIKFHTYVVRE